MATVSFRIDFQLAKQAEHEARLENRSKANQLEYWAKIGRAISSKIQLADAIAVAQGLKEITIVVPQNPQANPLESSDIFNDLESDRKNGTLSQKVTSARSYYEASLSKEGCLDRIDSATGKRETGQFENGEFRPL